MLNVTFSATPPAGNARALAASSPEGAALLGRVGQHVFKDEPEEFLPVLTDQGWRVLIGLGPRADLDPATLRRIGGGLFAELAELGMTDLTIDLGLSPVQCAELGYGARLRAWRMPARYRQTPDPDSVWHLRAIVIVTRLPGAADVCYRRLDSVAASVHFARDLVVAPGNDLTPPVFLERLRKIKGVTLEIVDPKKAGLNLLQAVGQGSVHKPALAVLHWQGGKRGDKPVVFVGKGITFDTGGVDIKDAEDMSLMKGDMGGAAAVAGALHCLAAREAPVNAIGVLAIAENMLSGGAMRPGDVVKSYQGKTVEIIDTDAEGRLVLADALAYAAARFAPGLMIDLATLTYAVEIALGYHRAGLFCADDALAAQLFAAGEAEDELLWRLPLTDLYDDAIASDIADLRNCTWARGPDALHAARFLQHFVPDDLPWAHLDIAGLSEADEDGPLAAEGPTGFGVRLLDRLVRDLFEIAS